MLALPGKVAAMVALPALFLAACNGSSPGPGTGGVQVVASFYPIEYFAKRIGGELVDVHNPVPPGAEPHDLELTPRSIERIQNARVFLYQGRGFQPAVDRALDTVKGPNLITKDVSEGIDLLGGSAEHDEGEGASQALAPDPHIWLDPVRAQTISQNIADALAEADPANAQTYSSNAAKLKGELQELDSEFEEGLATCKRDEIITSHAAFTYLAARYGLEQVSISGISPESEPSPARLQEIISFAREHDAKYIFFETLVEPSVSELVANEIGAQTLVLNPIEGLTEEQAAEGADYFSLMRENLANLRIALECGP